MKKAKENLLATAVSVVILTLTVPGVGYGAEFQYNLAISPQNPSPSDIVEITLSGEWYDACVPNRSSISLVGNNIYFDAILDYYWPEIGCAAVISGWTLTENVGPLSPGTYTVYASIPGYFRYTQVGTFDVTEQGNGNNTTAGPVAHWKFDEGGGSTAYDSAGSNHGSIFGAQWIDGIIGGALEFDGVDDYVALPHNAVTTTEFTVAGWANMFGLGGGVMNLNGIFEQNEDSAGDNRSCIILYAERDNYARAEIRSSVGSRQSLLYPRMNYNEWHHYVVTVGSSDLILYVDGNEVDRATNEQAGNYVTSIDNIDIGRIHSNGENKGFFNGLIDDVRTYDRALAAGEIQELYSQSSGPVAHWKLDEGGGSTAYDSAGSNDGVVYGAQWTTGQIGGALEFDGINDYVDCGNHGSLDITDEITISSWVKRPNFETFGVIAGKNNSVTPSIPTEGYGLFSYKEGFEFSFSSGSGGDFRRTTPRVSASANQWHHVVGTYDGNNAYLYVDGEQKASLGYIGTIVPAAGHPFYISYWRTAMSHYFDGEIDDVRIYDRALSAEEIEELWGGEIPTGDVYHVDTVNGNDLNNGLSKETAFKTIQTGIIAADVNNNDTVLVYPGVYREEVAFMGKAITLRSAEDAAVIEAPGDYAVSFYQGEGPDSTLKNFVIRNSERAVFVAGTYPTIRNLTVVDNQYGIAAYAWAEPDISNCILWNNSEADLVDCNAQYSLVQDESGPNLPDGLISHWAFDEGQGLIAYDSEGGNDGVIFDAQWTNGQLGGALDFDGVDDYVTLPDNEPIWLPQNNFTLSVWVYFEKDPSPAYEMILDLNYGGDSTPSYESGYNIQRSAGTGELWFQMTTTSNSDEDLFTSYVLDKNLWYHIVAVRDGGTQGVYINGQLSDSRTCSTSPIDFVNIYDDNKVNIGRFSLIGVSPTHHLQGKIDDVRIYGRALSAEEIEELYESSLGNPPLFADADNGDYHLLSERGRYWPGHDVWVLDEVTSPGIDGGDPASDFSAERNPHSGRINMGAHGGTAYASMSEWWPFGDNNRDGKVNWLDFAIMAENWLEGE